MAEQKGRSPWVWIFVGCGGCAVVIVVAIVAVFGLGFRWVNDMQAEMSDPAARESKVLDMLGAESLPEGYYPMLSLSAPFDVMSMAMISDLPPDADGKPGGFDRRFFVFLRVMTGKEDQQEFRDFMAGKRDDSSVLRQQRMNFQAGEVVGRGELDLEDMTVPYVLRRGSMRMHGEAEEGLSAVLFFDCASRGGAGPSLPGTGKLTMGIFFEKDDPEQAEAAETAEAAEAGEAVEDEPFDEAPLRQLLAPLNPCGG